MTDYADAAARHWSDAIQLNDLARYDNADQLFGLAAECAIKSAIVGLQASSATGEVSRSYWCHIDELWDKAPVQQLSRNFPGLALLLRQQNPYADWRVEHRYFVSGTTTAEQLSAHKDMAQRLLSAVQLLGTRRGKK